MLSPTPWPTPTPQGGISACGPPFPKVFVMLPAPVLTPSGAIEQANVQEPNVILGPDGLFHMTYSADCFGTDGRPESLFLTTSPDLIHWTRYGSEPITGRGHGGDSGKASMSYQVHIGPQWRIYYSDANGGISYDVSSDAYHYVYGGLAIAQNSLACSAGWDSGGLVFNGGDWWALAEGIGKVGCFTNWYSLFLFKPGFAIWPAPLSDRRLLGPS